MAICLCSALVGQPESTGCRDSEYWSKTCGGLLWSGSCRTGQEWRGWRSRASSVQVRQGSRESCLQPPRYGRGKKLSGFPLEDYRNRARDNRHKLSVESSSWIMNKKKSTKTTMRVAKCWSRWARKAVKSPSGSSWLLLALSRPLDHTTISSPFQCKLLVCDAVVRFWKQGRFQHCKHKQICLNQS